MKWKRIDIGSKVVFDYELKCPCCGALIAQIFRGDVTGKYQARILVKGGENNFVGRSFAAVRPLVNARLEELLNT